jgi:hypothetical protein
MEWPKTMALTTRRDRYRPSVSYPSNVPDIFSDCKGTRWLTEGWVSIDKLKMVEIIGHRAVWGATTLRITTPSIIAIRATFSTMA